MTILYIECTFFLFSRKFSNKEQKSKFHIPHFFVSSVPCVIYDSFRSISDQCA